MTSRSSSRITLPAPVNGAIFGPPWDMVPFWLARVLARLQNPRPKAALRSAES